MIFVYVAEQHRKELRAGLWKLGMLGTIEFLTLLSILSIFMRSASPSFIVTEELKNIPRGWDIYFAILNPCKLYYF
ncbi:hypothetical protein HZS_7626 [Henneguya salminicola]|nr:hypothetical protein HZS_7626 [Henneguya salminicola]